VGRRAGKFGIFVSYRRSDAQAAAGRLFDDLVGHFGKGHVFMDVASIPEGSSFPEVVRERVASSPVTIAVIGSEWSSAVEAGGRRRLDDPGDFVRLELETALKADRTVIPALVHGAAMPSKDALPKSLQPIADRHAIELSSSRWAYDVGKLITRLEQLERNAGRLTAALRRARRPGHRKRASLLVAAMAAALAAAIAAVVLTGGSAAAGPGLSGKYKRATSPSGALSLPIPVEWTTKADQWDPISNAESGEAIDVASPKAFSANTAFAPFKTSKIYTGAGKPFSAEIGARGVSHAVALRHLRSWLQQTNWTVDGCRVTEIADYTRPKYFGVMRTWTGCARVWRLLDFVAVSNDRCYALAGQVFANSDHTLAVLKKSVTQLEVNPARLPGKC
jgi:hypothetical protein